MLAKNDFDQELYKRILEAAKDQNIGPITFQRETLCELLHIPKNQPVKNKRASLYRVISDISAEQNISRKTIARNILRQSFGMPTDTVKKQIRIQKGDNRFQILSFLVTVDAATRYEIIEKSGVSDKSTIHILCHNPWFFEQFCSPGDKRAWWRITDAGRQAYFSMVKTVEGYNPQPQNIPEVMQKDLCTLVSR